MWVLKNSILFFYKVVNLKLNRLILLGTQINLI